MLIRFNNFKLLQGKEYSGVITDVIPNKETKQVVIKVQLNASKETYITSIPFSKSRNSELANLLDEFGIINEDDSVELDDLKNWEVLVTLHKSKNGKWYIRDLYPVFDEDEEDEEALVFDDEEEEE